MALQPQILSPKTSYQAYVAYVLSPEEFWIQLADGVSHLDTLMSDLNGRVLTVAAGPVSPKVPYAAVYSDDGRMYRALVTAKQEKDMYTVQFVDYGNSELKRANELRLLDGRFTDLPCQAVPCHLQGVSSSGTGELQSLVLDELATVTVLAQPSASGSYSVDIATKGVKSVLSYLRDRYPVSQQTKFKQPLDVQVGRDEEVVILRSDPGGYVCFRLQRLGPELDKLMADLAAVPAGTLRRLLLKSGAPCVASCGGKRYRAVVAEIREEMKVLVRLVDYGREAVVDDEDLYAVPSQFFELPAQAIVCRSATPVGQPPLACPCPGIVKVVGFDNGMPVASFQLHQQQQQQPGDAGRPEASAAAGGPDSSSVTIPRPMATIGQTLHCFVTLAVSPNYVAVQTAGCDLERLAGLQAALDQYCSSAQARRLDERRARVNAACAVRFAEDSLWYRGRVKSVDRDAAEVLLVDYGNAQRTPLAQLLELPPELAALPEQAVLLEFPAPICVSLADFLAAFVSAELIVQAVAVRGNMTVARLTADPRNDAVRRVFAGASSGSGAVPATGSLADPKPKGMAGGGVGPVPPPLHQLSLHDYADPQALVAGKPVSAAVCFSHGPARFWVYLKEREQDLLHLADAIAEHMEGGDGSGSRWNSAALVPGMPCLARSNTDWQWYRASVTELGLNGQHQVYFVDYGSSEAVPLSQICQLPPKLLQMLPSAQALECCLANVSVPEHLVEKAHERFGELTSAGDSIEIVMAGPAPASGPTPVSIHIPGVGPVAERLAKEGLVTLKSAGQQQLPGAGASGEPAATAAGKAARARLGYKALLLPEPGTKVAATCVHVVSPGSFWCHLRLYEEEMQFVLDELQRQCGGGSGPLPPPVADPRPGMPCCSRFSGDGLWYRARIRELSGADCLVDFVDYGNCERVSLDGALLQLPSSLLAVSPQAMPCALVGGGGRRGAGRQESWTPSECKEFESLVLCQPLQLLVSDLTADGVLVVDVLTQAGPVSGLMQAASPGSTARPRAEDGASASGKATFGGATTAADRAPTSPSRGRLLMAAVDAPAAHGAAAGKHQPLTVLVDSGSEIAGAAAAAAPAAGVRERVRVVWIVSPYQFYCHRESGEKQLLRIAQGVARVVEVGQPLRRPPVQGAVCVARYAVDGQWYRVLIKAALPTSLSMYFMDYGNTAAIESGATLLEMDSALADIPPQAVNCKLRGIVPSSVKGEWTDDVRDKMELVVSREEELYATFVACHRDSNLVDLCLVDGTSVADELIAAGVAKPVRGDMSLGTQSHSLSSVTAITTATGSKASASNPVVTEHSSPRRLPQHGGQGSGGQGSGGQGSGGGLASQAARRDSGSAPPSRREPAAASQTAWPAAASGFQPSRPDNGFSQAAKPGQGFSPATRPNQGFSPAARPDQGFHSAARPDSGSRSSTRPDSGGFRTRHDGGFQQPARHDGGFQQQSRHDSGFQPSNRADSGFAPSGGGRHGGSGGSASFTPTFAQRDADGDRPGRFNRKPVERAGQVPRRPRDNEQPRSFAGVGSLQQVGGGSSSEGGGDDWLRDEPTAAAKSTAADAVLPDAASEGFKGINLDAGTTYTAYVSYMPSEQSLDSPGASLQLCIQLQRDEALVEAIQEGIRQHVDTAATQPEPAAGASRPHIGAPCLAMYSGDNEWYRAEVVAFDAAADSVTVLFVDYGNSDMVAASKLRELPASLLRAAPRLAIGCLVSDVASLSDGVPELTADALREKLDCHTMTVTFAEAVTGYCGKSLLPCRVALQEQPATTDEACAASAADASEAALHLEDSRAKDGDEQERKGHASDSDDLTIIVGYSPAELEQGVEYEAVLTAYGSGVNDFWLQLRRDEDALTSLAAEIECFVAESGTDEAAYIGSPPAVGSTCLARYSSDSRWYRAEVAVVHPDTDTAELLYVDFGNTDIVQWPSRSVLQLPANIGQLPCYAVKCTLSSDSLASLQDHEAMPSDYMVVIFTSVPSDHHEAAVCCLLPPKQQPQLNGESTHQPAADDAAQVEEVQQAAVEAAEETGAEEAAEETDAEEAAEEAVTELQPTADETADDEAAAGAAASVSS